MKVYKFGGTSVGSPERLRALIPLISDGELKIVVLSAMAGTTNELAEISGLFSSGDREGAAGRAEQLRARYHAIADELYSSSTWGEKAHDLVDEHFNYIIALFSREFSRHNEKRILARGELLSTAMFHFLLSECGISSLLVPALNFMRIDKDGEPDYFYIRENLKRELAAVKDETLIITQGFICRNVFGETDNLRRGGSDYSATIIGAALTAEEVQIWTDISGMHNNDPRYVSNTKVIRNLSFSEAAELAFFGAKILHPSSINPARMKNIPVRLKNTLEPDDEGTLITSASALKDYTAVAAKDGITAIRIRSDRMLMAYGFMRRIFEAFEAYKTPIDMITTSEVSVSLTIEDPSNLEDIVKMLSSIGMVEVEHDQTIICVVGDFRPDRVGSAPEIFEALNDIPVKMISYGGSENSMSILINTSDKITALRSLGEKLFD
ncbi:MAG: aspartate kinase [Bacteroidales bacterium]|jgi:aspartate kinase|nr:aspartate kinase [Bacteroidales bacterium]MDD3735675.1 aspartate kinase [Bacteroidales bacterium]NLD63866.1 aspartate kinase [Bacteroidales bacterium]HNT92200.1 aspartate kinase [Bacteroidales bacterium]HOO66715.1 aspartate kinase [Bacteroidales bacterium]